jgi:fumarate reductase subunit C
MAKTSDAGMTRLLGERVRKSRWPARLDLAQSLTGLALGLCMWVHLLLVSSILLGKEAMWQVTLLLEADFLTKEPGGLPVLVSLAVAGVGGLFVLHAALAIRKFPGSWKQYVTFRSHVKMMRHKDTTLWWTQVVTAFIMFFLGSVHLWVMFTNPANIGPYASADRFWTGQMWPLYLVLLFAVELHGAVGLYRLAVKWGVFDGKDARVTRRRLSMLKTALTIFFLALGLATWAAYLKIGIEHADRAGERYVATNAD